MFWFAALALRFGSFCVVALELALFLAKRMGWVRPSL
jgi:hypothetical protein